MSITDPPLKESPDDLEKLEAVDPQRHAELMKRESATWSHDIFAAHIDNGEDSSNILFGCRKCGAYAWKRRGKLVEHCPRRPTTPFMAQRLDRMVNRGLFPTDHGALASTGRWRQRSSAG